MSWRNGKTKSKTGNTSASIKAAPPTQSQSQNPLPPPAPVRKRSALVLMLELFGVLAAIATIVAGTGYVLEKWNDTTLTIDFLGEIDQKKPFSIPLAIKNPSAIFSAHTPTVSCWIEVEYLNATGTHHTLEAVDQPTTSAGLAIRPGQSRNFLCNGPDNFLLTEGDKPGGPIIPIKQAEMLVESNYETWLPWPIEHHVVIRFVMLQTSNGYRWIKGEWAGTPTLITWPKNVPRMPREKPKPTN